MSATLPQQLEDIRARMVRNRADIDRLLERADAAEDRADAADERADAADLRALEERVRLDALDERLEVDHALLEELRAEGLVKQEKVDNLELALRTSRTIGAAMGIVMTQLRVDEADAFQILRRASSESNTKLRSIADDVVTTGDVTWLPTG